MFFSDPNRAYTILGVYHVTRSERFDRMEKGRGYTSLGFRLRGGSRFLTQSGTQNADSGSIVYIPRGVSYRRRTDGEEELIILHLSCHGEDDTELSFFDRADAKELFLQLLSAWEFGKAERYNRCMSLLYRIFETLEREEAFSRPQPPSAIRAGVEHLWKHYRDPALTIPHLASLSHVSEVYFRRLYYATYVESPWQTVLNLRFSYACECLRSGYYTIQETAANAGFSDIKHFRTAFTKRFGISPTQYARQNGC